MRKTLVKATALGLVLFCVCLSADIAYGMGGGGSHGDGRWGSAPPTGSAGSNSGDSNGQQSQQTRTGGYSSGGSYSYWDNRPGDPTPVSMPEPVTAILLGLGVIGLATATRKLAK